MIQKTDSVKLTAPLPLESGELISNVTLAYSSVGKVGQPCAVVFHDFTDSHAFDGPAHQGAGWNAGVIGPALSVETEGRRIISLGLLGSPFGSTSAEGEHIPSFSVEDMSRAAAAALTLLGVERAGAFIGSGLGAMVALRTASLFPTRTARVLAVGAGAALPASLQAQVGLCGQLVRAGGYKTARLEFLRKAWDRRALAEREGGIDAAEAYLSRLADEFITWFPPAAYVALSAAYASCDLKEALGQLGCPAFFVAGASDEVAPVTAVRDAYHRASAGSAKANFVELPVDGGHVNVWAALPRIKGQLREFLGALD